MSLMTNPPGAVQVALDARKLLELQALKPATRSRVVAAYRHDAPAVMSRIEGALQHLDCTGIREGAHRLKSSSAAIGANKLAGLYGELEAMARGENLDGSATIIASLRAELQRVLYGLSRLGGG
jgi:HPt (histidine-containing phosphotransfer) domain-containing protein